MHGSAWDMSKLGSIWSKPGCAWHLFKSVDRSKNQRSLLMTALLLWMLSAPPCIRNACAENPVAIDGQVRVRTELDGKSFDSKAGTRQYTDLRVRLGVERI